MLGCDPGVYKPDQGQYLNSLKIRLKYAKIKARALQNLGKIDQALELYDALSKQFPDFLEVLCDKFKFVYKDLDKQDDALELFKDKGDYDYFRFHQMAGITLC